MSRIPRMMEENGAESSTPVRRRTAGHPQLPAGTGGATVLGAGSPSGSGISLKNVAGCGRSLTSVDDFVQRHFGFLYLVASRRHADGTMKIQTLLEVGLVIRGRRRELNLTQGELAYKIGVGWQWVSAVERGKSRAEPGFVLRTFRAWVWPFRSIPGNTFGQAGRACQDGEFFPWVDWDAGTRPAGERWGFALEYTKTRFWGSIR